MEENCKYSGSIGLEVEMVFGLNEGRKVIGSLNLRWSIHGCMHVEEFQPKYVFSFSRYHNPSILIKLDLVNCRSSLICFYIFFPFWVLKDLFNQINLAYKSNFDLPPLEVDRYLT